MELRPCARCGVEFDAALDRCDRCGTSRADGTDGFEPIGGDDLRTGRWQVLGGSLDADVVLGSGDLGGRGVRARRVGALVEFQRTEGSAEIRIDGEIVSDSARVSLDKHEVTVGGVKVTDKMMPADTLGEDELPDFFEPVLIGRAPDCDYVLNEAAISGHHARLVREPAGLLLEDLDSANGTFVDERRIKRTAIGWRQGFDVANVTLRPIDVVRSVRSQRAATATSVVEAMSREELAQLLDGKVGEASRARVTSGMKAGAKLTVGRDPSCDIVIDSPNVSRMHAEIEAKPQGFVVRDLGSTNGTWVNGERIAEPRAVGIGDDVRVGPHRVELDGTTTSGPTTGTSAVGVRLDVHKLTRIVGAGLRVIDEVSFSVLPGEMVAVMGPSGAGKTSVLTTMAGYTPPSEGHVFLDGLSLYRHYDVFRRAIGYVPQEDVMHRTLTVEEVLRYHARIHFPAELSDAEIGSRIDAVLSQLDLAHVRHSLVGDELRRGLSGGQRKRLNVAMELLSQPSLLLLDEPTSGLDARSAMQLIRQCRGLASHGRTVIMTIHQPRREAFDLFDKILLLAAGGKVAYFGPVDGVKRYFAERSEVPPESARNPADYALDALDPLDEGARRKPDAWKSDYLESPENDRFVKGRMRRDQLQAARRGAGGSVKPAPALPQLLHLLRRYATLKWRDQSALIVQLAQAPVIAFLAVLLFHKGRFTPMLLEDDITPTLFVLMASAVWFGCSNVAREIVSERAIFRRERMGSLRAGPYLLSKLLVQGALVAVQIALLLVVLIPAIPLQGSALALAGTALLAGWAAMATGFLISTVARSELQAIQLVPLVILPQIMLSGILLPVTGKGATLMAKVLSQPILLRWAYGASLQVEYSKTAPHGEKAWSPLVKFWDRVGFQADVLAVDVAVMAGLGVACAVTSWIVLRRRDRTG